MSIDPEEIRFKPSGWDIKDLGVFSNGMQYKNISLKKRFLEILSTAFGKFWRSARYQ